MSVRLTPKFLKVKILLFGGYNTLMFIESAIKCDLLPEISSSRISSAKKEREKD
jgi:hypothetical protein